VAPGGCLIDSTRELLGTVFGLSAISVILRLVRRPYGLHAIGPQDHAIIQTHASHNENRHVLGTVFGLSAISVILRLVRRPYGLHAIGPQDHAIIQTHASHKETRHENSWEPFSVFLQFL
jgi:hypothetical protein